MTPGFVARAIAGTGTYVFSPSVALAPNTQYFFYTDATASNVLTGDTPSGVSGEDHYFTSSANADFGGPFNGVNFRLQGNDVPEPTTLLLLGLGLAGLGFARKQLH